jgi:hypothetical protein
MTEICVIELRFVDSGATQYSPLARPCIANSTISLVTQTQRKWNNPAFGGL